MGAGVASLLSTSSKNISTSAESVSAGARNRSPLPPTASQDARHDADREAGPRDSALSGPDPCRPLPFISIAIPRWRKRSFQANRNVPSKQRKQWLWWWSTGGTSSDMRLPRAQRALGHRQLRKQRAQPAVQPDRSRTAPGVLGRACDGSTTSRRIIPRRQRQRERSTESCYARDAPHCRAVCLPRCPRSNYGYAAAASSI